MDFNLLACSSCVFSATCVAHVCVCVCSHVSHIFHMFSAFSGKCPQTRLPYHKDLIMVAACQNTPFWLYKLESKQKYRQPEFRTFAIYSDPSFDRPPRVGGLPNSRSTTCGGHYLNPILSCRPAQQGCRVLSCCARLPGGPEYRCNVHVFL